MNTPPQPRIEKPPLILWLFWLLVASLCTVIVMRTTIVTDITAFLPGPATPAQAQLAQQLRDGVASRVALIGLEGKDAAALAQLSKHMLEDLKNDQQFAWISNGSASDFEAERSLIFNARYLLSPRITAEHFSEQSLHESALALEEALRTSAAPLIKPFIARDFTNEFLTVLSQLAPNHTSQSRYGVWFDSEGHTAILLAATKASGADIDAQAAAHTRIETAFKQALATLDVADKQSIQLQLTGPGMFAVASRDAIERDALRLALTAAILIAVVLYLVLRQIRLLWAAALPIGLGVLAGLAAVSLGFGTIHGITLAFGITLIGEAIDYAIYIQVQRRGTAADRNLWRTLWLALLTSGAGFVAMMFSVFQGLVQLGVLSIVGIGVATLAARTLLPYLLRPLPVETLAHLSIAQRLLNPGWHWRGFALTMTVLAIAVLIHRGPTLWSDELAAISPLAPAAGQRDAQMRQTLALPDMRFIVAIRGDTLDEALANTEHLHTVFDQLITTQAISAYQSPAYLLPSKTTQQARRDALPSEQVLRARLEKAVEGTALRAGAFEPFIASVQAARTARGPSLEYFKGTRLGERLDAQLHPTNGRSSATAFVTLSQVNDVHALRAAINVSPNATLIDLKSDVERLIAEYRDRAAWAALGGAILVALLLAMRLRDARTTARIVLALACAVIITAAILALTGSALTLFHLVALLLVVGIGSNYALFFGLSEARQKTASEYRSAMPASVFLCVTTTFIAFALLATSSAPVLRMIGMTAAIGALVSFFTALTIAQPLRKTIR